MLPFTNMKKTGVGLQSQGFSPQLPRVIQTGLTSSMDLKQITRVYIQTSRK